MTEVEQALAWVELHVEQIRTTEMFVAGSDSRYLFRFAGQESTSLLGLYRLYRDRLNGLQYTGPRRSEIKQEQP